MLKVGWAQYPAVREKREIFTTMPTLCQTTPIFLHDRDCYREFLDKKMNCKLNGIDLEAIKAHSLILVTAD